IAIFDALLKIGQRLGLLPSEPRKGSLALSQLENEPVVRLERQVEQPQPLVIQDAAPLLAIAELVELRRGRLIVSLRRGPRAVTLQHLDDCLALRGRKPTLEFTNQSLLLRGRK